MIKRGRESRIDVIEVQAGDDTRYCINLCAGGLGGQAEELVDAEMKARWGSFTYLRAAAEMALNLPEFEIELKRPELPAQTIKAVNVVVANGRTVGGGYEVAPDANPQDSLMDVVVVHPAPATSLAAIAARLFAGDYTQADEVTHFRTRELSVRSTPPLPFTIDGNLLGDLPVRFRVLPRALRMIT